MSESQNAFTHRVVSPLETKRSRGDAGENDGENQGKRRRDRDRADPPEGNQDGIQENQGNQEPKEPENPEPEEYLEPKEPTVPPLPTAAEWIEHQLTHMPYKPWCATCVKNAAANNPHKTVHHSRGVAMFSMDYMFMTQKPSEEDLRYPI